MSGDPRVSVIIPTKDCLHWLPAAIESIGGRDDVEILVVDDGSRDGTDIWLAHVAGRDPRVRALAGRRAGAAAARNVALEVARAPLIAFLDADDTWLPGKLDAQLALHTRAPELAFSFTDYRQLSPTGSDLGTCFEYWPCFRARHHDKSDPFMLQGAVAQIYAENVVGTSTVIARTDLLREQKGFGMELPNSEDWELWLKLARRGPVCCLPQVFTSYLMHRPGNQTGQRRARILSMRVIAARYREDARRQDSASLDICDARVLDAQAEVEEAEGRRLKALALRLGALRRHPTQRALAQATAAILCR